MKHDPASTGKTDVVAPGFEPASQKPPEEEENDTTELTISAGGLFTSGNARSIALTSAGKFRLRRGYSQLSAAAAGNYARAAAERASGLETTVENLQGRVRYDRFLSENLALFIGVSALRNRFQGLDLRLNVDPGVAYYVIDEKMHRFWFELGYDLQHDIRRDENIEEALLLEGQVLEKSETRHNGRAFSGYEISLNETVSFVTGLEYLQDVQETKNWRINWDVGLTSTIAGNFSTATTFSLKYDNNPLPSVESTDLMTAVSLVYNFM